MNNDSQDLGVSSVKVVIFFIAYPDIFYIATVGI